MSLYICEKCGVIENTALCIPDNVDIKNKEKYPFKTSLQMDIDNEHLCSKCNTGEWHYKFESKYPTEIEKAYAELSEYTYITKYDHCMSFETFQQVYNSPRWDYFQEKIKWAKENKEELTYNSELDELFTNEELAKRKIKKMLNKSLGNIFCRL